MSLTLQQANAQLANATTAEQLSNIIKQLDISAQGSVTVLYSGMTANGIHSNDIVKAMLNAGSDIRVIDKTEVAKLAKF